MDDAWVRHVTSILEYLDACAMSPDGQALQSSRDLMTSLDAWSFFGSSEHYGLQIRALDILQRIAYHDVDGEAVTDIASWSLERWLRVLQRYPRSVPALRGIGCWWLSRAQPGLARIHAVDGSSSGSEGSRHPSSVEVGPHCEEETQANIQIQREAEARLGTHDYVEARGYLQPATEYLRRAVDEASSQSNITSHLLITAAEAYMSLGNVSSPRDGEALFTQAIYYLRQASRIPGYPLPAHLQKWLDDYGRWVN
ncbi:uncharacterized protein PV09_01575 [Verruconis gallopava]|uniref:Uncharacterized protein n=1 Tax=Verruconis gallopava TaxID=253628 RepID=A0A0D2B8P5_9PEZI|nr:uncharacterized protein PV09_01575 [Verruconis gallopava]KIW07629.1 hypothetical protein PV09_01575 [Verruconis gallopava]